MLLTSHLHLAPRLRMSGANASVPLYAFMAWTLTVPFALRNIMWLFNKMLCTILWFLTEKIRKLPVPQSEHKHNSGKSCSIQQRNWNFVKYLFLFSQLWTENAEVNMCVRSRPYEIFRRGTRAVNIHRPIIFCSQHLSVYSLTKNTSWPAKQVYKFYVYGSVHRWSILIIVERDATKSNLFLILQVHSTCFGFQPHPSSGLHKTVTTASGTVQLPPSNVAKLAWSRWREVAVQKIWAVPEVVVKVLCPLFDGCGWHPKHVEWTCRIIDCFVLHLVGQLLI